jgi:hypothetical protein
MLFTFCTCVPEQTEPVEHLLLTSIAVSGGVYVGENSAEILAVSVADIAQHLVREGVEFR